MAKVLTAAAVAKLRPAAKRREVPDGGSPGLYLTIFPSGAKSWTMRFRRPDGKPTKITLGPVSLAGGETAEAPVRGAPLTLAAARRMATEVNHQRARGVDVAAGLRAEKVQKELAAEGRAATLFPDVCRRFVEDHARPKNRRWRDAARMLGLDYPQDGGAPTIIKNSLCWRWRDKPVREITADECFALISEVKRRGAPGLAPRIEGSSDSRARQFGAYLSSLLSWAARNRMAAANPLAAVGLPPPSRPRDRALTDPELRLVWQACADLGEPFGALIKMLLLTGARLREVAQMVRSELSDDGATWTIPGSRTKNKRPHVVPLSALAREVLASVKRIEGKPGYIFTTTSRSPISGFSRMKRRLDALVTAAAREAGRDPPAPWAIHDLRRTAATGMAEIGIAPHIVEAVLNHVSGARAGVAGTYNRAAYAAEKRSALERWAAHVEGLVEGKASNVVAMTRAS